jgi:diadenylate cyclase
VLDNLSFLASQLRFQDLFDLMDSSGWWCTGSWFSSNGRARSKCFLGLGILAIGYILSIWLEFFTFNWILEKFFCQSFRHCRHSVSGRDSGGFLAQIGANPFLTGSNTAHESQIIEEIIKGVFHARPKRGIRRAGGD